MPEPARSNNAFRAGVPDRTTNYFVSNRVSGAARSMFSQAQYLSDYYLQDGSFL